MLAGLMNPRFLVLITVMMVLLIAMACGDDATATPRPTATSAPTTAPPPATATTAATEPTATPTKPAATSTPRPTAKPGEPTHTPLPPTPTSAPTATRPAATQRPTATPVPTPKPTPTLGFVTSSVERLVVATPLVANETGFIWRGSASHTHMQPMFETLIGVDRNDGKSVPRLATAWEQSADGMDWTFDLQKGVKWHFGWGDYTAEDLVHTWKMITREDSIASETPKWQKWIRDENDFTIHNPHKITFNMQAFEPDLIFILTAKLGVWLIQSKALWEAEGDKGLSKKGAGTGPFHFKSRQLGIGVVYEREENHWRRTPEFRELDLRYVPEDATRLAMLLTKEAQITETTRDLQPVAVEQGFKVVTAATTGTPIISFFGGLYFTEPDKLIETDPFVNVKVREAMNRAIDRQEIVDEIYGGKATPAYLHFNKPEWQGWDPGWVERGPELYGFDPEKARQLLAEAGYADGFDMTLYYFPLPGAPELLPISEAMIQYWQDVGIDAKLVSVDFPVVRAKYKGYDLHSEMFTFNPGSSRPPSFGFRLYNYSPESCCLTYLHPEFDVLMEELIAETDIVERDRLQRETGEYHFTRYTTLPIVFVKFQVLVDPEAIEDYSFSGAYIGFSDFEYVVAAK